MCVHTFASGPSLDESGVVGGGRLNMKERSRS